jgi:hypothetical protein
MYARAYVLVDESNTARAVRLDRIAAGGLFGLFLVGTVLLLLPVV